MLQIHLFDTDPLQEFRACCTEGDALVLYIQEPHGIQPAQDCAYRPFPDAGFHGDALPGHLPPFEEGDGQLLHDEHDFPVAVGKAVDRGVEDFQHMTPIDRASYIMIFGVFGLRSTYVSIRIGLVGIGLFK